MAHRHSHDHDEGGHGHHDHAPVFAAPGHDHSHCAGTVLARAEALSAERGVRLTSIRRQILATIVGTKSSMT